MSHMMLVQPQFSDCLLFAVIEFQRSCFGAAPFCALSFVHVSRHVGGADLLDLDFGTISLLYF